MHTYKAKTPVSGGFASFFIFTASEGGGNMCSVIGTLIYPDDYEKFIKAFEKTKSIGKFKKLNKPLGRVKEKIELSKCDIERIMG